MINNAKIWGERKVKLYNEPLKAFLVNDLRAFKSAENDKHLIYHFKKIHESGTLADLKKSRNS